MNEVEVYRLRERLTRLVREEPEVVAALLLGLAQGGRFEVVIRDEQPKPSGEGIAWAEGGAGYDYEIVRKG